ncbi:hypothetical protein [Streptomyces sp. NBC_01803]|uniref:hypothetical protein n=1 Tax=Streptomyces sp. NBC_01803 TaxID=2975946 RepID=UPI002DDA06BF|nr:hypothetical protein [Streptomyces sp. NBC_01803]WSA44999.1 hypothetical protein OIE51_12715 [Streptomyces sp. NBC_01803]
MSVVHELRLTREAILIPPSETDANPWAEYVAGPVTASCTCGLTLTGLDAAREHCPHPETTDIGTHRDGPDALHCCTACGGRLRRTADGDLVPVGG